MRSYNDGNLKTFEADDDLIGVSCYEIDASDLRQNVDPARDIAQLNNRSSLGQILFCEIRKWGAKFYQGLPNTLGVVGRTLDPQIDVASRTWQPMSGNR